MTKKSTKKTKTKAKTEPKTKWVNPEDYIEPLYMDGLQGRMLYLPPPAGKKKEILLIYGHHASLERLFGMAEFLNRYGGVTMPDLPGFGGMEAFYKLGQKPTLDNMADYLAAFIKLRYKRRRITIIGLSYGFVVMTRMLQKYPELAKKVDLLVSLVGFVHKDDFKIKKSERFWFLTVGYLGSNRILAAFFKHIVFRPTPIKLGYTLLAPKHAKFKDANKAEQQARIDFEIYLWQCNDVRTQAYTGLGFLKLDLCNIQVDLPVHHVAVDNDHYFDNDMVEQHMKVVFKDVDMLMSSSPAHAPTVIADAASVTPFIPPRLRRLLSKE